MLFRESETKLGGTDQEAFRSELSATLRQDASSFRQMAKTAFSAFMDKGKMVAAGLALAAAFAVAAPQGAFAKSDITESYILTTMNESQKISAAIEYRNDLNKAAGITEKDEKTPADCPGGTVAARKRMDFRHNAAQEKATNMDELMKVVCVTDVDSMNLEFILQRPEVQKMIAQSRETKSVAMRTGK